MKTLRTGVLGLGLRGTSFLQNVLLDMAELEIVAICDTIQERVSNSLKLFKNKPKAYYDAIQLLENEELDCVFIFTPWISHIHLSIEAMNRKIPVAMEVGGAYDEHELWKLVDTYEKTKTPFMMLENCCYGRLEMMALNMVELGELGEIIHLSGGYMHDLRYEVSEGYYNKHYRIDNYRKRNTENYPTHELGPLAKLIDINRGNRFLTISSQSSKARGLKEYINNNPSENVDKVRGLNFNQGDIVITTIKCANGEIISLKLDTTLPRYYSRGFYVQGTKGIINEENMSVFLEKDTTAEDHFEWSKHFSNIEQYYEKYDHPVWKKYLEEGVKEGHGGMDYLVAKAFVNALINDEKMPIDVYDAAAWLSVTTLAEKSIALGGQLLAFPDFTQGKWIYDELTFVDEKSR